LLAARDVGLDFLVTTEHAEKGFDETVSTASR